MPALNGKTKTENDRYNLFGWKHCNSHRFCRTSLKFGMHIARARAQIHDNAKMDGISFAGTRTYVTVNALQTKKKHQMNYDVPGFVWWLITGSMRTSGREMTRNGGAWILINFHQKHTSESDNRHMQCRLLGCPDNYIFIPKPRVYARAILILFGFLFPTLCVPYRNP